MLDAVFAPTTDALLDGRALAPARVADLGCGPGATTARLVDRVPRRRGHRLRRVGGVPRRGARGRAGRRLRRRRRDRAAPRRAVRPRVRPVPARPPAGRRRRDPDVDGRARARRRRSCSRRPSTSRAPTRGSRGTRRCRTPGSRRPARTSTPAPTSPPRSRPTSRSSSTAWSTSTSPPARPPAMFWRNLATWGADAVAQGLITEADRAALLTHLRDARRRPDPRPLHLDPPPDGPAPDLTATVRAGARA